MILESAVKFMATIIISTSPLTEQGLHSLLNKINEFTIIKEPGKEKVEPKKKKLPAGGFEMAMGLFSGLEKK